MASVRAQYALVFQKGIVVFWETLNKHIEHLRQVFMLFQRAGVILKVNNCSFFTNTIHYLGPSYNIADSIFPLTRLTELSTFNIHIT